MELITAPFFPVASDWPHPWIFLAGGISGCPEWQDIVIDRLLSYRNDSGNPLTGTLFNPRRKDFPMGDPDAGRIQIKWEFQQLMKCDIFSIWFCKEQIQPICLYELGRYVAKAEFCTESPGVTGPYLCIGVEPGYPRSFDVYTQVHLVVPLLRIEYSLDTHINNIVKCVEYWWEDQAGC